MSTPAPIPQQSPTAMSYLHDIGALQTELRSAMLAISGNRLSVLEDSLWRQQVLCTSLKHLSRSLSTEAVERPLLDRIQQASLDLQQLNRTYAQLVQQSSQSTDLLSRLCRSYGDTAPASAIAAAPTPTWSCEA